MFSALGLVPLGCGGAFRDATDDSSGGKASAGTSSGGDTSGGKASGGATSGGKASGGSASGGATSGGGSAKFPCDKPTEVGAGYEQCANGTVHRPKVAECPSSLPRPSTKIALPGDGMCTSDADCVAAPHGYCGAGVQVPGGFCNYGCVKDEECGPGFICRCGDPVGQCVVSKCTSDADCGEGLRCQSYDASHGCGSLAFACQTPKDTCGGDGDCMGGFCDATSGAFTCVNGGCAVGRPFLVEGEPRLASVVRRSDWCDAPSVDFGELTGVERARLAAAWARIGQMEHASVAAFARFSLQLLQLGAPPELVALTSRAIADETRHAKLAFGLASSLAGEQLGPGPLDIERSLLETSLVDVVRLVMREGCIGETAAALEAREAAVHAHGAELQTLLGEVADDEAGHAELAWRFVAWALERDGRSVRPVIEAELRRARRELPASVDLPTSADELKSLCAGIVPERTRAELRRAAFSEVIEPCGLALLAQRPADTTENQVLSA